MTTPTDTSDSSQNAQQLYQQITSFLDFVRPLADQLFAVEGPEAAQQIREDVQSDFQSGGTAPSPSVASIATVVGMAGQSAPQVVYVRAALEGARLTADFFKDYAETVQRETTTRHDITARKEVRLEEIALAKSVMEQYLASTFDERRANFHELFVRLDRAQEKGDLQGMQLVLSGILDLAKSSPFKDLATFKKHLNDPTFVLEL